MVMILVIMMVRMVMMVMRVMMVMIVVIMMVRMMVMMMIVVIMMMMNLWTGGHQPFLDSPPPHLSVIWTLVWNDHNYHQYHHLNMDICLKVTSHFKSILLFDYRVITHKPSPYISIYTIQIYLWTPKRA